TLQAISECGGRNFNAITIPSVLLGYRQQPTFAVAYIEPALRLAEALTGAGQPFIGQRGCGWDFKARCVVVMVVKFGQHTARQLSVHENDVAPYKTPERVVILASQPMGC